MKRKKENVSTGYLHLKLYVKLTTVINVCGI